MKIRITKKHDNKDVWFNEYVGEEFEVLSMSAISQATVALPRLDFSYPTRLLVWKKNKRYTEGVIVRSCYDFVL